MNKVIISCLVLFFITPGFCQDRIMLLTGKVLTGKVVTYDEAYLEYTYKKKNEVKTDLLERYRIYSTIDSSNKETILYIRDSTVGNFMTQPEMKLFIDGERDAYKNFKTRGSNVTGFIFALGVSLTDTYKRQDTTSLFASKLFFNGFFRDEPSIVHFIPPFIYPILAGLPSISIRISDVTEKNNLLQQPYLEGFERVGKQKRRFGGLAYSAMGSAAGICLYFLGKLIQ